ncbi:MAG: hypothetical protein AUI14_10720 [Actinobacteria bacterium 13_2_20CM_2_71_6]|nr:MAG: hypothetical protein AUI14_10720 [Actinobacteria bacterium 13_2_20CM_2_71_6]
MPDNTDVPAYADVPAASGGAVGNPGVVITPSPGLEALLAEAQQTWVARARDPEAAVPGWRPFEDAFPTFYQFTNRPR